MKIKGFDKDLKCRGFQFEIGKEYDTGAPDEKLELCSNTVFHYCNSLQDVHEYYSCTQDNRFCEIEVLGREITDGKKYGTNKIRILREIVGEELLQLKGLINGNAGLFNTGHRNTGNCNTGYINTGDRNTGDRNTGHWNTGNRNTGDWNTGSRNSGLFNSCNYSNGVFCNTEDMNIRIFNKPSGMGLSEFFNSKYYNAIISAPFYLTEWISYTDKEMDTDEKRLIGGYLKKYTFKDACRNWWANLTEENKKIITEIPNFDSKIFFDITGIDVNKSYIAKV